MPRRNHTGRQELMHLGKDLLVPNHTVAFAGEKQKIQVATRKET